MIPATYPSRINELTGRTEMVISVLPSVVGLARWSDYIPIKYVEGYNNTEGMTDNEGFIAVTVVDSTSLVPFGDYVPVYIDNDATDAWMVEADGYIPVEHSGSSSLRRILNFAGSQYGAIDTPIAFTDDFEVEIKCASTESGVAAESLFGDSVFAGSINYLVVENTGGKIVFRTADGVVSWTHLNAHRDGKIHTLTAYRSGLTIGIKLDGVIKASALLGAASQVDIDLIGALGNNTVIQDLFNGQILSVKFTDQSGSPDVVTNYVFDSGSDLYQLPRGEGLGNELWNNTTTIPFGSQINHTTALALISGKTYALKVSGLSAGEDTRYTNGGWQSLSNDVELVFVSLANQSLSLRDFVEAQTGVTVTIRQLPDLTCLLTNFSTTDWNRYTQQRNITHDAGVIGEAWIRDDLWTGGTVNELPPLTTDGSHTMGAGFVNAGDVLFVKNIPQSSGLVGVNWGSGYRSPDSVGYIIADNSLSIIFRNTHATETSPSFTPIINKILEVA